MIVIGPLFVCELRSVRLCWQELGSLAARLLQLGIMYALTKWLAPDYSGMSVRGR